MAMTVKSTKGSTHCCSRRRM